MRALSFGAVLWDIIKGKEHIGGAPFNVAAHLSQLGADSLMLTCIGKDKLGQNALSQMSRLHVSTEFVQISGFHPTGWAKVELDAHGVPTFSFPDDPAYEYIEADNDLIKQITQRNVDVICFGTLEQKGPTTRTSLLNVLENVKTPHVFYDVNIRLDYYPLDVVSRSLQFSTMVKLNDDELPLISHLLYGSHLPGNDFAAQLGRDFGVKIVCLTKGAQGCTVFSDGDARDIAGVNVTVADTVGAGDAFSAAFLNHYLRTADPFESARQGNLYGAYVASQPGAIPECSAQIKQALGLADTRPE